MTLLFLKFRQDRDAYRSRIREHVREYEVYVLDYCITSNHVHLLLDAPERLEVGGFMREIAREFARGYNRRKLRSNAFWRDNYHATVVEDGEYLWQCLCYIELNMVRWGRPSPGMGMGGLSRDYGTSAKVSSD